MELQTAHWAAGDGWREPLPAWDGERTLVLAFGGAGLVETPEPLADLAARYPRSIVVGCSTAGEILGRTLSDDGVSVAVARFARARLSLAVEPVADPAQSRDVGVRLGERLLAADADLAAVFVLSDGTGVNGGALAAGLTEGTPDGVTITGGLAADGDRFARTWVLVDGAPVDGAVTAVGLSGPGLRIGHGSRGGWDGFGPLRQVTRAVGNVVHELDGQPALELYRRYLGDRADQLPGAALLFPLAVRLPGQAERQVVRTILGIDETARTMTFAGDVPTGSMAQLMRANVDELVDGAAGAASASDVPGAPAQLAVAISCVGRRLLMGRRTEDELDAVADALAPGTSLVGFYSYGELSPLSAGTCDLHNQTMTITTFAETA